MATQLEIIAEKERQAHLTRNSYVEKNGYGVTHENALSNGDEKGKGETGTIGSSVDIQARVENLLRNPYSSNNQYNSKNPNALSDGDEKGKGENNGSVGSLTDVNSRKDSVARNKFGETKKYPDF